MELHLELGTLKENAAAPRLLPCGKAIDPLRQSSSDHAMTSPATSCAAAARTKSCTQPAGEHLVCVHGDAI